MPPLPRTLPTAAGTGYVSPARGFGKLLAGISFGTLAGVTQDATSVELALGHAAAGVQALVRRKIRSVTVHLSPKKGLGTQLGQTVKIDDLPDRVRHALDEPRVPRRR